MMQYLPLKPAQQTLSRHSGFARYSIPVLLSPRQDFLCSSKFRNRPDTVAHWRFEGEAGKIVHVVPESNMPNRSDLQLWKCATNDCTIAFSAPWRNFVKSMGAFAKNSASVAWSGCPFTKGKCAGMTSEFDETRTFLNVMRENPALIVDGTGESFTHEMFVCCRTNNLYFTGGAADKTLFFGEAGGVGGFSSNGTANWIVSQETTGTAEGLAKIQLKYSYAVSSSGTTVTAAAYVTTNEWHHLALTYDADARKVSFYVDYKPLHEKTLDEGYHITRGVRIVGAGDQIYNHFQGFDGAIDEWRISRRALSPEEFLRQGDGSGLILLFR